MEDKQYIEIITKLAEIGSDVKGMHRRQDITNGRMAKSEEKIIALEKTDINILDRLDQLKLRNDEREADEKQKKQFADGNKQYWSRNIMERVLWTTVAIVGIILTKLGIININL